MGRFITTRDSRKGTLLSTLVAVSMCSSIDECITKGFVTLKTFVGGIWTTFELGDIWRDQPNIGTPPSDDQFKDDLDQIETM